MAGMTRSGLEPATADESDLAQVEREAQHEVKRIQRRMWLTRLLGLGLGLVLITWAVLAPNLSDRAQLIIGLLFATEATSLGFALALYDRRTHVRAVERYLDRLRALAQQLQEMSERDSLTGLYNHGYLLRRLQEEISLAQRHRRPLSVIILDLNEFKEVNDRHGHLVGDEVLQLIATTIRKQVRCHDVVARYGGDEFCLVLPETDLAGAESVAKKLRATVADLAERLQGLTDTPISFGCGICTCPDDGATARALIAAADAQLYREKQAQRLKRAGPTRAAPSTQTA